MALVGVGEVGMVHQRGLQNARCRGLLRYDTMATSTTHLFGEPWARKQEGLLDVS